MSGRLVAGLTAAFLIIIVIALAVTALLVDAAGGSPARDPAGGWDGPAALLWLQIAGIGALSLAAWGAVLGGVRVMLRRRRDPWQDIEWQSGKWDNSQSQSGTGQASPSVQQSTHRVASVTLAGASPEAGAGATLADEPAARIERLTAELNRDPLTRLLNRQSFMANLRAALQSHHPDYGHVLVFRQRDLKALNRHTPRELIDQWLRNTAQRLGDMLQQNAPVPDYVLARLNGSDFALLMPGATTPQAVVWAERVRHLLREVRLPLGETGLCRWAIGLVHYGHGDNMVDVLASLDHAVMRSESAGAERLVLGDTASLDVAGGELAWHDVLVTALEQHRFFLQVEPVYRLSGEVVRYDAALMLQSEPGAPAVSPDIFIPAAVRLGLSAHCDIQAIRLGLDWLEHRDDALSVRVSLPTLTQDDFAPRLQAILEDRPQAARRLLLEIDAHAISALYARVRNLNDILQRCGVGLGVRRVSEQFGAMTLLHTLQLRYLRLGGAFIRGLSHSPGSRELAASVVATATRMGFEICADDVPDQACAAVLTELGLDVMAGPGVEAASGTTSATGRPHQTDVTSLASVDSRLSSDSVVLPTAQGEDAALHDATPRITPLRQRTGSADESMSTHAATQRLQDVLTQLSVAGDLRRETSVLMSHELRTPLSTISAAAQSLERILEGSGEQIDGRIARIRRAASRMTELLDAFSNAQRDVSEPLQALRQVVDVNVLVGEVVDALRPETGHELHMTSCPGLAAWCDPTLMRVVIRNLLHNAIKYSPANRPIVVTLAKDCHADVPTCRIDVIDQGSGMSEGDLARIFDAHYRRASHREVAGTGVGLSIARRLCEYQDGQLLAQSTLGAGTRFTVVVPAAE